MGPIILPLLRRPTEPTELNRWPTVQWPQGHMEVEEVVVVVAGVAEEEEEEDLKVPMDQVASSPPTSGKAIGCAPGEEIQQRGEA